MLLMHHTNCYPRTLRFAVENMANPQFRQNGTLFRPNFRFVPTTTEPRNTFYQTASRFISIFRLVGHFQITPDFVVDVWYTPFHGRQITLSANFF